MGKHLIRALAAALALALTAGAVALAEPPVVVRAGNLILKLYGGVTPRALPKHELAPVGFHGGGSLATLDGSRPPALREVEIDVDRDAAVEVAGIPVCTEGKLAARDTDTVRRICPGSLLGEGEATVEVGFPEQAPIVSTGPLLLFNGGERGGVTTLYLHAYVDIPAPTAIVATAKVTKTKGHFQLHFVFEVPPIAGGAGSVIHSELTTMRFLSHGGERHSFLYARCPDGRFRARGIFEFRDGTSVTGNVVRACEGVG